MKFVYLVIFLTTYAYGSIPLNYAQKASILEIKKTSGRIYNQLNQMLKKNHLTNRSEIKAAKSVSFKLYKTAKNLYEYSVVVNQETNDSGKSISVNYDHITPFLLNLEKQFLKLNASITSPIKSIRFQKNKAKVAYNLEFLLQNLIEQGLFSEIKAPIKNASLAHQLTFVENRIQEDYLKIFFHLRDFNQDTKEMLQLVKEKAWKTIGFNPNHKRRVRDKIYYPIYKQLSYLEEQTEKLADDLMDTRNSSVDFKLFIARYIDIKEGLNQLIEDANEFEMNISEKEAVHQIFQIHLNIENELRVINKDYNPNPNSHIKLTRGAYKYRRGSEICSLVSSPGDIILTKSKADDPSLYSDFQTPLVARTIQAIEILKFADMDISYSHAELLTKIKGTSDFQAWSFYPWMFNAFKEEGEQKPSFLFIHRKFKHCEYDSEGNETSCQGYGDYRDSSAIIRVKALSYSKETELKEKAIKKLDDKESFKYLSPIGVCSDFVNWTYGNTITSNWNRIPGLRHIIRLAWIPEGYQTPDNLYNSYMTERVCELDNKKLTYPHTTNLQALVKRLKVNLESSNEDIKAHAEKNIKLLKKNKLLDENGEARFDIVEFHKK